MGRIHPMMHSKFHPCLELLHPFPHHRQHYPTAPNIFGLTNVESCYVVCIIGNVFCCVIKLSLHKAATLGVSASVCLMEVGRSIEVCHKLAYSLAETSLFWKRRATKEALLVHNRSSTSIWDCIPSSYFWNEAKLGVVSSAWWPLYKGDNNGRALMIETAKRLSLNRDIISRHSFLELFCVASYRRFNCITVCIVCICDPTKPVGEINQVNKILELLCAAH